MEQYNTYNYVLKLYTVYIYSIYMCVCVCVCVYTVNNVYL